MKVRPVALDHDGSKEGQGRGCYRLICTSGALMKARHTQ